jgi:hypothetical protein
MWRDQTHIGILRMSSQQWFWNWIWFKVLVRRWMIKYEVVFFFNLHILILNFNLLYGHIQVFNLCAFFNGHIQGFNNLLWSLWLIIKVLLVGNGWKSMYSWELD